MASARLELSKAIAIANVLSWPSLQFLLRK
jgi:hypothetical protein